MVDLIKPFIFIRKIKLLKFEGKVINKNLLTQTIVGKIFRIKERNQAKLDKKKKLITAFKSLVSGRKIGHYALSSHNFDLFLIFTYFI